MKRALGVMSKKGRFRNMLIKKCAMAGTTHNDANISPVVRQSLQHWGYRLTKRDADAYVKRGDAKLNLGDQQGACSDYEKSFYSGKKTQFSLEVCHAIVMFN